MSFHETAAKLGRCQASTEKLEESNLPSQFSMVVCTAVLLNSDLQNLGSTAEPTDQPARCPDSRSRLIVIPYETRGQPPSFHNEPWALAWTTRAFPPET